MAMIPRRRRWLRRIAVSFLVLLLSVLAVPLAFRGAAAVRESADAAALAPSGGHFVGVGDQHVFLLEHSPPTDGTPPRPEGLVVVLISGVGAWSGTWRDTLEALGGAGHRAIALDLPPFGFSDPPPDHSYSRADQAERIWGVLDALGVRNAVLVGHSLGGAPTLEAALSRPDRVQGLVLVAGAIGLGSPADGGLTASLLEVGVLQRALAASTVVNPWFTRTAVQSMVADPADVTDDRLAQSQAYFGVRGTTAAVGGWLPRAVSADPESLSLQPVHIRGFDVPTRLIWGNRDTVTPLSQAEQLDGLFPRADLVVIDGVGHIPHIEEVGVFHAALLPFLTSLGADLP